MNTKFTIFSTLCTYVCVLFRIAAMRIFVSSWIGTLLTHLAHKLPEEKQEQEKDPPDRMMLMTFRDDQKVRQNT